MNLMKFEPMKPEPPVTRMVVKLLLISYSLLLRLCRRADMRGVLSDEPPEAGAPVRHLGAVVPDQGFLRQHRVGGAPGLGRILVRGQRIDDTIALEDAVLPAQPHDLEGELAPVRLAVVG